uniref:Uncharacterized protein n=1 Tax=Elaeophora elaphi TaxID=1147741 RepID=A0A0R3RLK5_9BILA
MLEINLNILGILHQKLTRMDMSHQNLLRKKISILK